MKNDWWRIIAGVLVLIVGVVLLLSELEVIALRGAVWGALALLAGGIVFTAVWLSDTREWWPLIPASIMGAWGLATLLDLLGLPSWLTTLLGFLGSSLPFFYIFRRLGTQEGWWALIPGGIMAAWGLGSTLGALGLADALVPLIGFLGSALPFLYIFSLDRKTNWWALIPGGIMAFIGLVATLDQVVGEAWTATFVLWAIALVFLAVFFADRRNGWALIPAGVMAVVGLGVSPLTRSLSVIGPVALVLVGVFVVVRTLLRR